MTTTSTNDLPLAQKPALTYDEVEQLGYCTARTLRRLVVTGAVKRSVLRAGRTIRFLQTVLVDELKQQKR